MSGKIRCKRYICTVAGIFSVKNAKALCSNKLQQQERICLCFSKGCRKVSNKLAVNINYCHITYQLHRPEWASRCCVAMPSYAFIHPEERCPCPLRRPEVCTFIPLVQLEMNPLLFYSIFDFMFGCCGHGHSQHTVNTHSFWLAPEMSTEYTHTL